MSTCNCGVKPLELPSTNEKYAPFVPYESNEPLRDYSNIFQFMKQSEREYIMSQFKGVTRTFICNPRIPTDKTVSDGIYSAVMAYRRDFSGKMKMAFGNGGDRKLGNIPEEDYCKSMDVDMVWNLGEKIQSSSWLVEKYQNSAV